MTVFERVRVSASELKKLPYNEPEPESEQHFQNVVINSGHIHGNTNFQGTHSTAPTKKLKTSTTPKDIIQPDHATVTNDDECEGSHISEGSHMSESTDKSYMFVEDRLIPDDKIPQIRLYYLSMFEISTCGSHDFHEMRSDITVDERLAPSSIIPLPAAQCLPVNSTHSLWSFKLCLVNFEFQLNSAQIWTSSKDNSGLLNAKQRRHFCKLAQKRTSSLYEHCPSLHIEWDVASNVYLNCSLNIQFCRHDFILFTKDGLEIGTGEIKPHNASQQTIETDRCKVAESLKKQLHKRLISARTERELATYGVMIHSDQIELTTMTLTVDGEYKYVAVYEATLPTSKDTYAFMEETLEILLQFTSCAEESLQTGDEQQQELLLPRYTPFLKPTVYMITDEE